MKMKERLEEYAEPVSPAAWEELEADLQRLPTASPAPKRRPMWPWWAAAAVLLLLIGFSALWQMPQVDEKQRMAYVPASPTPPSQEASSQPSAYAAEEEPSSATPAVAAAPAATDVSAAPRHDFPHPQLHQQPTASVDSCHRPSAYPQPSHREQTPQQHQPQHRRRENTRPVQRRSLQQPHSSRQTGADWSLALAVGNPGRVLGMGVGETVNTSGPAYTYQSVAPVHWNECASSILNVGDGEELVFREGMPYLLKDTEEKAEIEHKQPVSVGISLRKSLSGRISVETGVVYTYLASDVKYPGTSTVVEQKLHYLGIPVRVNYDVWKKKRFLLYASAGGMVEKCIYGRVDGEKESVDPLQFSVTGAVGAQVNVSSRVGLYIEPGVAYYFDDGSSVETIRKEHPCNFSLQGGIRLMY